MRFGIKAKLRLSFAALVILPALGSLVVTRYIVVKRFQEEFEGRLSAVAEQAHSEYARRGEELASRVFGLFEGSARNTTFLDDYLGELKRGPLSAESQRALISDLSSIASAAGIDMLKIVNQQGRILAQTPLRGREGHKDTQALSLLENTPKSPVLVWERWPDQSGGAEKLLTLEVGIEVTRYGKPIYAIAGRRLGKNFLSALVGQSGAKVALEDFSKTPLLKEEGFETFEKYPSRRISLQGIEDEKVSNNLYSLRIAISDDNQKKAIEQLFLVSVAIVATGVLIAWLLGFILARRLTKPIDTLVRRVGEVARGELEGEISKTRNDEVGQLIDSFNEMTRRLEDSQERLKHAERIAAWQEIARRLAHEIKNPLFPIQMSIETLQKTFGRQNFQEIFDESTTAILEEVERLKKIVSEFSQFARMPQPEFALIDIAETLQTSLRLCNAANEEANIDVQTHIEPYLPSISGDHEQLSQVFLNLLVNAREAMPKGGTLRVHALQKEDEVIISIQDTGIGLSKTAKTKLFTPYYTTKDHGTGLGLAIAHRIVTSHNGRIYVEGEEGKGTRFFLRFPISLQVG